jgi:large subunit ribosomal protein L22
MQATAVLKNVRTSAQKGRLVADLIRGLPVARALEVLEFSPKKAAKSVRKVLESAIANAENNHGLDVDKLYVKEAHVGPALVMKRFKAKSKGRAGRIIKPFANITVVVHEPPQPAAKPAETKEAA